MSDRESPRYYVKLIQGNGQTVQTDLGDRLLSLIYEDEEKKADKLKFTIDNGWLDLLDTDLVNHGNILEVTWGYPGNMSPPRQVVIAKVTGFQVLTVECLNRGLLMNKVVKSTTYENTSRSKIVQQIAQANGFGPEKQHIEDTSSVHAHVTQGRLTDAQFLKRLAHLEGFIFFVDYDGLHFHSRRFNQQPHREFTWYFQPDEGDEIEAIAFDLDPGVKWGKLKVKGYDPFTKKHFTTSSSNADTPREGAAPNVELIDLATGAISGLQSLVSETVQPSAVPGGAAGAQKHADGKLTHGMQETLKMTLTAVGDPQMVAKSIVNVKGIGRRFSGPWYVQSIKHTVGSGYKMAIKLMRDGRHEFGSPSQAKRAKTATTTTAPDLNAIDTVNLDSGQVQTVFRDSAGREAVPPPNGGTK